MILEDQTVFDGVKKPYSQLQLLRGKEFLIFDPDLNQVTVREIDDSFVDTPAGLLFSSI